MKKLLSKRMLALLLVIVITGGLAAGCGNNGNNTSTNDSESDTTNETAGQAEAIDPEAVAAIIDGNDIPASEVFYMLYNLQASYERYGVTDWDAIYTDGKTYGDVLREDLEDSVLQINYLYNLAKEKGFELTDEEQEAIDTDTASFMDYVSDSVKERYGFTEDNVREVFTKSSMGNKAFVAARDEIVAAQSEDVIEENKFRTIQHILISTTQETSQTDESGETVKAETVDEETYKAGQRALAEEVLAKAQAGEDFAALAEEYNDDSGSEYSLNTAGNNPSGNSFVTEFVEAANALNDGEISGIVETEYGYHIIKCITTFDEEVSMTVRQSVAGNELYSRFGTWLEGIDYEFKEVWTNYVIAALPVEEETTEDTTEGTDAASDTAEETTAGTDTTADIEETE